MRGEDLIQAHGALRDASEALIAVVERLAAALDASRIDVDHAVEQVIRLGAELRELAERAATIARVERPAWNDPGGLCAAIQALADALAAHHLEGQRLSRIATELRAGAIIHRQAVKRARLEGLRTAAVDEVVATDPKQAAEIPWPAPDQPTWIPWILQLEEPDASAAYSRLEAILPALFEFLISLERESWQDASDSPRSVEPAAATPAVATPDLPRSVEPVSTTPAVATPDSPRSVEPLSATPSVATQNSSVSPSATGATESRRDTPRLTVREEHGDASPEPHPPAVPSQAAQPAAEIPAVVTRQGAAALAVAAGQGAGQPQAPISVVHADGAEESPNLGSDPFIVATRLRSRRTTPAMALVNGLPPPVALPAELRTFEAYRCRVWRGPTGVVEPAPWLNVRFGESLERSAERAIHERQWAHLVIFARAGEMLAEKRVPTARDVNSLLSLLERQESETAVRGIDPQRTSMLTRLAGEPSSSAAVRLALFLESLRPSVDGSEPISFPALRHLLEHAGFDCPPMETFLLAAYQVAMEGGQPLDVICRFERQAPDYDPVDLEARLTKARAALRETVKRHWSGAGKRIQTAHCRAVWAQFMAHSQTALDALSAPTSPITIEPRDLEQLKRRYVQLADRGGARYVDRAKMDRAVEELLDAAREVIYSGRRLQKEHRRAAPTKATSDLEAAFQALPRSAAGPKVSGVYPALLHTLVSTLPTARRPATVLTLDDFVAHVALVETVPVVTERGDGPVLVDVRELLDPLAAAAHLLEPAARPEAGEVQRLASYFHDLDRDDLLLHLEPNSDRESRYANSALTHLQVAVQHELSAARILLQQLDEGAHTITGDIRRVVEEADRLACERTPYELRPEFLQEWLARVSEVGRKAVADTIAALESQLSGLAEEMRERIHAELAQGGVAQALAVLAGEPRHQPSGLRATIRRPEAEAMAKSLDPIAALNRTHGHAAALRDSWLKGLGNEESNRELCRLFVEFVFDPRRRRWKVIERKKGVAPGFSVACDSIRSWITESGLNPSFLPQVTRFRELVVTTPPVSPSDASFVRQTADSVARGIDGRIIVVLAPRITRSVREAFREAARERRFTGVALLDNVDLMRLVNPGGQQPDLPLALLELVLEQQPRWMSVNPFERQEGQHTKAEMYVGRREEAKNLAMRNVYSRLFSGRRLGKSALLKHITDAYDTKPLPSGHRLRVAYVPIVGIDDESQIVDHIQQEFEKQFNYRTSLEGASPSERLKRLVSGFLREHQRVSVLVFLDEADMFVAAQIRRYETAQEACLTWVMRTALEAEKDNMDQPRVRFVFAGYRATHLSEGAWANWGDVLRLQPLAADEATQLVAGPLARLGVDAASEASNIAFRCGYQPAVILRFGEQLLEHLDATVTPAGRESVAVTTEHVTHVYQHPNVQQEVRTVVWNNFQGNPFAKVVFAALLLEFSRLPPGAQMTDAPRQVLERLRQLVPDFLSSETVKGTPVDRVARELRSFVDRSLLVEGNDGPQSYRLRFPHHLPVLLQEDQEAIIGQESQALGSEPDNIDVIRSMLPDTALGSVVYAMSQDGRAAGLDAVVVTSHWTESLEAGAARVATRLGLDYAGPTTSTDVSWSPPATVVAKVARRGPGGAFACPLYVGGIDLLRWALGAGSERQLEVASVARIGLPHLRWWFERVRGINFSGANPGPRFLELTGGIPHLVAHLDGELKRRVGFEGETAAEGALQDVLHGYDAHLEEHIALLHRGPVSVSLTQREQELVIMYVRAGQEFGDGWRDAMLAWHEFAGLMDWPESVKTLRQVGPADYVALGVLRRSGLVPTDHNGLWNGPLDSWGTLAVADPLVRIAAVLERCLLT